MERTKDLVRESGGRKECLGGGSNMRKDREEIENVAWLEFRVI